VPDTVQRDGQRERCPFDTSSPLIKITARAAEPRAHEDDGGDDADQCGLDQPRRGRGHAALFQAQQGDHSCLYTGCTPGAECQQHRQQRGQRGRPGTRQPQSACLTGLGHFPPGTCGSAGEHGLLPQLVDALSSSTSEPTSARFSAYLSARFTALETLPETSSVRHRGPPLLARDSGADAASAMASSASAAAAKGSARSRSTATNRTTSRRQRTGQNPACWIR